MKKVIVSLLAAAAIVGCDRDDTPVSATGSVSFVVNGSGPDAGRIQELTPQKVIVSIEDKNGKVVLNNKVFDLVSKEQEYQTEALPFATGEYVVTKYLVISGTTAAYASPRSGAVKANLIDKPLPFEFTVAASQQNSVAPRIISISSEDTPQVFGYPDFGYDVPDAETPEFYNVRVKLDLTLGNINYQNIDAKFVVKGFNQDNSIAWTDDYEYIGPEPNDIKIKDGYHHYLIEVSKWGKTLSQIYTRATLFERRVKQGEVPITQVFQADVEPKKLATSVTSWSQQVNGETVMRPTTKTDYEYYNGRIALIRYSVWSETENAFVDDTKSEFTYSGDNVYQITNRRMSDDAVSSEDTYTYDDQGFATHIQHKGEGVTAEVDLEHLYNDRIVKVSYKLSNGTSFQYEFVNLNGSVTSDRTMRGSQLCSEATYTSDKNINPLKHLGYTDYLMRNYSVSNRLTEKANYIGCAFPSLVAESYSYVYDEHGYPLRATTHFKGMESTTEVQYIYRN